LFKFSEISPTRAGLVLSADILHKMASSVQNAKRSIFYRTSAGKCEPALLEENALNMSHSKLYYSR
jgi:hypothetical protein